MLRASDQTRVVCCSLRAVSPIGIWRSIYTFTTRIRSMIWICYCRVISIVDFRFQERSGVDQVTRHGQPLLTFTFALAILLAIVLIQLNLLVGGSVAITEPVLASAGTLSQRITVTLSHRECKRATDSLSRWVKPSRASLKEAASQLLCSKRQPPTMNS